MGAARVYLGGHPHSPCEGFEGCFNDVVRVNHAQMTLHIRQLDGINSHHIIEATFKAFARAMRMATEVDSRRAHEIPSSKGVL